MTYIPGSLTTGKTQKAYTPGSLTGGISASSTYKPGSLTSGGIPTGKIDSSSSLYNIASQNGLQKEADNIMKANSGEETKKFFSGGVISDIFDVLSAAQYGTVGMIKGKTFREGVRTRSSFTEDFTDKGFAGLVTGIVLDIAFDPLTYIAPATLVKKIPILSKAAKLGRETLLGRKVTKGIKGTDKTFETLEAKTKAQRTGQYLAKKVAWMFGADPIFRETFERGTKNVAISTKAVTDMGKDVADLSQETASKLLKRDETGRFTRVNIKELSKVLKPEEYEVVAKIYSKIDALGKEAVDLGLLSKEKYEENIGEYLKNAYKEFEESKGVFGYGKVGVKGIKARKEGLTLEKMQELGQIDNPAYLLFKSALDLTKDVENAKLLKNVAEKWGTDIAQEGFEQIPKTVKYAGLGGKYVPKDMAEYIREIVPATEKSGLEKLGQNIIGNFKFAKVVMNPATHARNIASNKILNYWKLGMNPLDPRTIRSESKALKEIVSGKGKYIDEATPLGYNIDTFASAEMKGLLDSPDALGMGKKKLAQVKKKLGDLYQAEENQSKLAAYIFNREVKKLEPEEAWKLAEAATFNYAQVTPFIRKLRESFFGFPFITFTAKATPAAIETMAKNPGRISIIQKIKQGIEAQAGIEKTDEERKNEPEWVKNGFFVRLPGEDSRGRARYFDMTYLIPFGELMTGSFTQRPVDRETGTQKGLAPTLMSKSPAINLIGEIAKNRDFYGNKIWKDSDPSEKQIKDLMLHLTKTVAPPVVSDLIPGGYDENGERRQAGFQGAVTPEEEAKQKRTIQQELLRLIGAKIQPIDADIQETYTEWNRKKGLQTLLRENGIGKDFNKFYIPK